MPDGRFPGSGVLVGATFTGVDWVLVAVAVVLLGASALLAVAETGLVRMSKAKALALSDEGRRGGRVLLRLVENPQRFLNPVILLVLVSQLVVATLVGILAAHWFGAWGVTVATVVEIAVIFVLGEAVPKNWAVRNPERAALLTAPLVSAIVGFWPVRVLSGALIGLANALLGVRGAVAGPDVSESELLALADVAMEEEVIETEERALIHSIIEFGDTIVREVMVPRTGMVTVDADESVESALDEAMTAGYSRIPVVDNHIDDVVGVAYAKDLITMVRTGTGSEPVGPHARRAHFVPETKRVSALMREMQAETFHLAIVIDEYGGTAGLVTLEDLIEELVGEIVDEFDVEEPPIVRLASGEARVSGRMVVSEVNERLGTHLPTGAWDTVGGLLLDVLGRIPEEGQAVDVGGARLVADRVRGRRIERVRLRPLAGSGDDAAGADREDASGAAAPPGPSTGGSTGRAAGAPSGRPGAAGRA
ncbi:MAG: hemolysin family protein [Actinomycetota bacterium]|jgi:CBS domain containing-hemolysin-like protein|nr:hemolysin family protein [Actinomycetota bacterium]